jgi:hypothetical protein
MSNPNLDLGDTPKGVRPTDDQKALLRAAMGVGVVAYDDFSRYAEGTLIPNLSTTADGTPYYVKMVHGSEATRPPIVSMGGLVPQGNNLMYIGCDFPQEIKRFDFDVTCHYLGGAERNWFTLACHAAPILNSSGDWAELPVNMLHIELDITGIFKFGIGEGGVAFDVIPPDRGVTTAGITPWNPGLLTGGGCDLGRPWRLTVEFYGHTCRISAFGHGHEFTDPRIVPPKAMYFEGYGNQPSTRRDIVVLHRWAASMDYSEPFRGCFMAERLGDFAVNTGQIPLKSKIFAGAERGTHGVLTFAGAWANGNQVAIGTRTYTGATGTPGTNQFKVGVSASADRNALMAAINLGDGGGNLYGSSTTIHEKVRAVPGAGNTLMVIAKDVRDTAIATTTTAPNGSWFAATLQHKVPVESWVGGNLEAITGDNVINGHTYVSGRLMECPALNAGPYHGAYVAGTSAPFYVPSGTQVISQIRGCPTNGGGDSEEGLWVIHTAATETNKRLYLEVTGAGLVWDTGTVILNDQKFIIKLTRLRFGSAAFEPLNFILEVSQNGVTTVTPIIGYFGSNFTGQLDYVITAVTSFNGEVAPKFARVISYVK